ncbi:14584_t:CDS:2, partial [Gigaspora rosea]
DAVNKIDVIGTVVDGVIFPLPLTYLAKEKKISKETFQAELEKDNEWIDEKMGLLQ